MRAAGGREHDDDRSEEHGADFHGQGRYTKRGGLSPHGAILYPTVASAEAFASMKMPCGAEAAALDRPWSLHAPAACGTRPASAEAGPLSASLAFVDQLGQVSPISLAVPVE